MKSLVQQALLMLSCKKNKQSRKHRVILYDMKEKKNPEKQEAHGCPHGPASAAAGCISSHRSAYHPAMRMGLDEQKPE